MIISSILRLQLNINNTIKGWQEDRSFTLILRLQLNINNTMPIKEV
jgi:hypothetical protein